MPPIIGLTTGGRIENDFTGDYYQSFFYIPDLYVESVRRAGGIPVLLPPDNADEAEALIPRLDGLIVTGGADIDPKHYGGNRQHPSLTKHDSERDNSELALIHAWLKTDKPMLCVCRGMQVLNVAMGGTMTEHVPDVRDVDIHRGFDGLWSIHEVLVDEHSLLARVMGASKVETYSGHHQAVKAIGKDLCVVAQAPDGIVEALAHEKHPWLLGVQWHPEKSSATDPTQQALFDGLVKEAAK
jgi:putative glutamine amidotransferase